MTRSMTAFSRKELTAPWGTLSWEIRSVNHRYLEILPRLPDTLRELEPEIREQLRQQISRGKVECTLRLKTEAATPTEPQVNEAYVKHLVAAADQINAIVGASVPMSVATLMQWPGVLQTPDTDQSELLVSAKNLLQEALVEFVAHREREGTVLKELILDRLTQINELASQVRSLMPDILQGQRERISNRLTELLAQVDQDRVEQELVFLAQKTDVEEELDRLVTHVEEVRRTLIKGGAVGRRLDFLMQELNREANTLGSKSINAQTSQISVELKVLIEQMREQIQNIE